MIRPDKIYPRNQYEIVWYNNTVSQKTGSEIVSILNGASPKIKKIILKSIIK